MSKLLLSVMGAFAEFERALICERQREGIELRRPGRLRYIGDAKTLTIAQVNALRQPAGQGESKASLARELCISCETVYQYLKAGQSA